MKIYLYLILISNILLNTSIAPLQQKQQNVPYYKITQTSSINSLDPLRLQQTLSLLVGLPSPLQYWVHSYFETIDHHSLKEQNISRFLILKNALRFLKKHYNLTPSNICQYGGNTIPVRDALWYTKNKARDQELPVSEQLMYQFIADLLIRVKQYYKN